MVSTAGRRRSAEAGLPATDPLSGGGGLGRLRLQTIVRLRWLAVAGQTAAVLIVYLWLQFPLPLGFCLAAITLSAWINIMLSLRWRANLRLQDKFAALMLGYDIVQLAVLLYLTGGLQNPFAFLFLVPVTISASSLSVGKTLWLGGLALVLATLLAIFHMPLPWHPDRPQPIPPLYVIGMWTALVCGTVFAAIYARFIAEEGRRMSAALAATEMVLAREQQLSALDGLAAAAAHELGTPLATIALVAKELKRELPEADRFRDDLELLTSQAERCREILSRLAESGAEGDHVFGQMRLKVMLEELAQPVRESEVDILIDAMPVPGTEGPAIEEPILPRNPAIRYGLGNLLDNAADFANQRVTIQVRWDEDTIGITIGDDGPGFAQDIIEKLGEPYISTRKGESLSGAHEREGMGLGFFIAKTLLERTGATLTLSNAAPPQHGAIVRIEWPRDKIDLGRLTMRDALFHWQRA